MKQASLIVFLFFSVITQARAGGAPDSLWRVPPDTLAYIRQLNRESARQLQEGRWSAAASSAMRGLELARLLGDGEGEALSLLNLGRAHAGEGDNRKALSSYIRSLKLQGLYNNRRLSERLFYHIAAGFARLRQYPLALKFFYKAGLQEGRFRKAAVAMGPGAHLLQEPFLYADADSLVADTLQAFALYDNVLEVTPDDRIVVDQDTVIISGNDRKSRELRAEEITGAFDDGRKAIAYGLLLHVKQPVAGERKAFTGINTVGHMFITLIKFNADSGYVSRTFGFYPDKDYLLSATPLLPVSSSMFKDDTGHEWDEMLARFITRRKFNRILRMVKRYSRSKYNLNKNNCTDFGLVVAGIAGIRISETRGSWPLGGGNNPANAGQSVREGKIELEDPAPVFVYPPPAGP